MTYLFSEKSHAKKTKSLSDILLQIKRLFSFLWWISERICQLRHFYDPLVVLVIFLQTKRFFQMSYVPSVLVSYSIEFVTKTNATFVCTFITKSPMDLF